MSTPAPEKVVAQCASCGAQLRLDVKFAGRKIQCPRCKGAVAVPQMQAPPPPPMAAGAPPRGHAAPPQQAGYSGDEFGQRGMVNRAPTTARNDPFQRNDGPAPRATRGAGGPKSGRRSRAGGGNTGRRERGATGSRGRGGSTRSLRGGPAGPSRGGNSTNLIIAISAGAVTLLVLIVFLVGGGGSESTTTTDTGRSAQDGGGDEGTEPTPEPQITASEYQDQLIADYMKASTFNRKKNVLVSAYGDASERGELMEHWRTRAVEFVTDLGIEGKFGLESDRARRSAANETYNEFVGQLKLEDKEILDRLATTTIDNSEQNDAPQWAYEQLGYSFFTIPLWNHSTVTEDMFLAYVMRQQIELPDVIKNSEDDWVSPETRAEIDAIVADLRQGDVGDRFNSLLEGGFALRAESLESLLRQDQILQEVLESEDAEMVFVRETPFVVMLTNPAGERLDQNRVDSRADLMNSVWSWWKTMIGRYDLVSYKEGETAEEPEPLPWFSFRSLQEFSAYQEKLGRTLGSFTRAYFVPARLPDGSSGHGSVVFWEEDDEATGPPEPLEEAVIVHETVHQLMERWSATGLFGMESHCFVEGTAELYSSMEKHGPDYTFEGVWNHPGRIAHLRNIRDNVFNRNQGIFDWNITDDDWVYYQLPAMWCMFHNYLPGYLCQTMGLEAVRNSEYRRSPQAVGWSAQGGASPLSYGLSWTMLYFFQEEYPEEYERLFRIFMSGEEKNAEAYIKAFNIDDLPSTLPEQGRLREQQDVTPAVNVFMQRVRILKESPTIQRLNREYIDWLNDKLDEGE